MDQQSHRLDHADSGTDVGATPPAQPMNTNGNSLVLEQNPLQMANPDVFSAMGDGQPPMQGASLAGNGNAVPRDSTSGQVPMMMANGGSIPIPPLNMVSA
ncbi:hypothetical protein E4U43_001275, partial [Claviceps pusilla]